MKAKRTRAKPGKARRRILVVAGAAVVFLTFVVKETIRDYLRDLRDSLTAADSLFTVEGDINSIALHMVKLDEDMTAVSIKRQVNGNSADYSTQIQNTLALLQLRDSALQSDFDRIKRLVEKMPPGARESTKNNFSRMDELLMKFHDETERKTEQIKKGPRDSVTLGLAQVDLGLLIVTDVPILKMGNDILEVARQQEERLDKLYSRYTTFAFILYVIGWGLGLYGALSGTGLQEGEP